MTKSLGSPSRCSDCGRIALRHPDGEEICRSCGGKLIVETRLQIRTMLRGERAAPFPKRAGAAGWS